MNLYNSKSQTDWLYATENVVHTFSHSVSFSSLLELIPGLKKHLLEVGDIKLERFVNGNPEKGKQAIPIYDTDIEMSLHVGIK